MKEAFEIAKRELLEPAQLSEQELNKVMGQLLSSKIDYADLYFQSSYSEAWVLEDGIIKSGTFDIDRGVGVRAVSGEKTGFAYADDIIFPSLIDAATAARSIVKSGGEGNVQAYHRLPGQCLYRPLNPLESLTNDQKVELLAKINTYLREKDARVKQVNLTLGSEYETIYIMTSDGHTAADVRPLVRFNVSVIVEEHGRRENGYAGGGGRYDYHELIGNDRLFHYADEALRQALQNLIAVPAPAGPMPVVLGPGWPGVLLHEAVGHGLEGDFNRKGISVYSGKIGQKVASDVCTVVDDGTLEKRRGSLNVDDEGIATQRNVLIENGILKGYMMDKRNAKLMGTQSTGNGRRESYSTLPMPRMTNTYMLAGNATHDEIIKSVKRGLYAVNFGGGQVDITSGKFVFSASEAYLIEDGKITSPVKGATLIGNGPQVLNHVSMVGNNLELDQGIGVCGKNGQSVPVGVGQPTLLIDELTVGGTRK